MEKKNSEKSDKKLGFHKTRQNLIKQTTEGNNK